MMNFIAAKKQGTRGPQPHILFNATARIGVSTQESQIRSTTEFSQYCMNNTLKRYAAFAEPEDGTGFVWFSRKPYSTEAFRNLMAVATEFRQRIGV